MPGVTSTASLLGTPDPRGPARCHQRPLGRPLRDDTDEWATLRPPNPVARVPGAAYPAASWPISLSSPTA